MMNRALINRLINKAGIWAAKQLLGSLPFVGLVFKAIFFGIELWKEVQRHVKEELDPVPLYALA
jgi:hypothetical protein